MLRVALVTQSYYPVMGGVSEHVHHLALELARRGHEVWIVTGARWRGPSPALELPAEAGPGRRVKIVRLGRTVSVPANGGRAAVVLAPRLSRLTTRFLPPDFDLVHIHSPLEPCLPLEALRSFSAPLVGTFHSAGRSTWAYERCRRWLEPRLRRLTLRLAVSESAAAYVSGCFPGEYRIVPNGVAPARFVADPARHQGRGEPLRILAVGRLEPRKGLDVLLSALALLREREAPAFRLAVVGAGCRLNALRRQARSLDLPVRFLGGVPLEELPHHYREADLLIAPATHGESFGVVLLEAMAAGLPIVASDLSGYREVLEGSGAGVLVPPGRPESLAGALMQMASSPELRIEHGRRGQEHVRRYAWDAVTSLVEAAYEDALGRAGRIPADRRGRGIALGEPKVSPRAAAASSPLPGPIS